MSHLDYKKKAKKDLKKEEVFIIRQKLEKIIKSGEQVTIDGEHGQALDLLERLGDINMNFAILKETMIGFTVHALKKSSSDEEIILKSKTLIKVRMFEGKIKKVSSESFSNFFSISIIKVSKYESTACITLLWFKY